MEKSALRKIFIEKRKTLSEIERLDSCRKICERLFENFDFGNINYLHVYLPITKFREVDTLPIIEKIRRDFPQIKICVPRIAANNLLESIEFSPAADLRENRWQISEPASGKIIESDLIDIVFVPLLCFDRKGFRVGYGKGFYDRFLKNCRADCLKIGLNYFEPIKEISDLNEFDIALDYAQTLDRTFNFQQSK